MPFVKQGDISYLTASCKNNYARRWVTVRIPGSPTVASHLVENKSCITLQNAAWSTSSSTVGALEAGDN